jgi:hypothetical protein
MILHQHVPRPAVLRKDAQGEWPQKGLALAWAKKQPPRQSFCKTPHSLLLKYIIFAERTGMC